MRDEGTEFELAPAGSHQAVCVDVVDLGIVKTAFGDKRKVRIYWQIAEDRKEDGLPYLVTKSYNAKLSYGTSLRIDLESWRGREFTREELQGFDLENVVGANCIINVVHEAKGEKTYANVASVSPLLKGLSKIAVRGYTRKKDKPGYKPPVVPESAETPTDSAPDLGLADDDIPF